MNEQIKMKIYNYIPIFAQNILCTYVGRKLNSTRYGKNFDTWTKFYSESASWSESELREYQREKMIELIRHCFATVPFYREKWRSLGLSSDDFTDLDDISKLPYTTKEDIHNNLKELISDNYNQKELLKSMTSGSTGTPVTRFFTKKETQQHYAIFWNRMRQGVSVGDRYAAFQGWDVVPALQKKPPYWRENFAGNQRLYSLRHLSPEKLKYYAQSLSGEPFAYYQGYVSIMTIIAEFMMENGLQLNHSPKAVFATAEYLNPESRKILEKAWKTKVWDEYCQTECCAMIRQCEYGNHHVQMDYGIVEFKPIEHDEGYLLAEIICTGFVPFASPLIRYRLGDRVLVDEKRKCLCGAPGPVIKQIEGRMSNYILTPDGRKYPCMHGLGKMLRNVRRTQIIQEDIDKITIRVVPYPEFNKDDEQYLLSRFREKIGCDINVGIEKVDELERSKGGKVFTVINRIKDVKIPVNV
jgi:phenylacetate-CoA ligase